MVTFSCFIPTNHNYKSHSKHTKHHARYGPGTTVYRPTNLWRMLICSNGFVSGVIDARGSIMMHISQI